MNSLIQFCLFLCVCILPNSVLGQTVFQGLVLDADTGLPVPYANIGFIDKGLGTVSEENGTFTLSFAPAEFSALDTLKVSSLAYRVHKIPFTELQHKGATPSEIRMEPEILSLNEVILTGGKRENRNKNEKMIGYSFVGQQKNGSWEGEGALGGELVTKINISKKKRQLNAFYFYVLKNTSDSLLIRVNVYDGSSPYPEKKITNKNIIYTLKTTLGKVGIDLMPYNIIVADDFSIGIELLKVYGNDIGLVLAGDDTPGVSYRRYSSQGEWKRYAKDALTYFVSTTLLEEAEENELPNETLVSNYSNEQLLQTLVKNKETIHGFVFYEGQKLVNAQIQNLNTKAVVKTDETGRYSLKAQVNDELEFSYPSLAVEVRKVLETQFSINVSLKEKIVELDEVTVTSAAKQKRTQQELYEDYSNDTGIIKTSFGLFDKQTSGVSMKIIDESEFAKGATSLGGLLRGQVSGLSMPPMDNSDGSTIIYLRQGGTGHPIPAVYEIDGFIVEGFPQFLDVSQIKRIAVLSGLSAVAKYGTIGAGGVIIINTKAANFSSSVASDKVKPYAQEMGATPMTEEEARRNWPDFLQELYGSKTWAEAHKIYTSYEPIYRSHPNFNIDASTYFLEFWTEEAFTELLIAENLNRFKNDVNYIKALAFLLDKTGKNDQAVTLYKQILLLRSNSVQSYRDLADAYIQNRQDHNGKNLYARYFNLLKDGYFSSPPDALQHVINSEVKTLLGISEEKTNSPLDTFLDKEDEKTRILIEWSDDAAEIKFQFIAPDYKMSEWANSMDGESRESLIRKGYTSKDFFIYGNAGSWTINANYKGNQTGLAIYLKITVSTGYGTNHQKDNIDIFRLDVKNVNRKLLQIP